VNWRCMCMAPLTLSSCFEHPLTVFLVGTASLKIPLRKRKQIRCRGLQVNLLLRQVRVRIMMQLQRSDGTAGGTCQCHKRLSRIPPRLIPVPTRVVWVPTRVVWVPTRAVWIPARAVRASSRMIRAPTRVVRVPLMRHKLLA
jgi:hypothetical protein